MVYRSRGERHQIADYYRASFNVDEPRGQSLALAG
jgi:hypothetical protein